MSGAAMHTIWGALGLLHTLGHQNRGYGVFFGRSQASMLSVRKELSVKCTTISSSGEAAQEAEKAGEQPDPPENVLCFCQKPAVLRVCGRGARNPGLRFFTCVHSVPGYRVNKLSEEEMRTPRCAFFSWVDVPPKREKKQTLKKAKKSEETRGSGKARSEAGSDEEQKPKKSRVRKSKTTEAAENASEEDKPKRGKPRKSEAVNAEEKSGEAVEKPKRSRPRKTDAVADDAGNDKSEMTVEKSTAAESPSKPNKCCTSAHVTNPDGEEQKQTAVPAKSKKKAAAADKNLDGEDHKQNAIAVKSKKKAAAADKNLDGEEQKQSAVPAKSKAEAPANKNPDSEAQERNGVGAKSKNKAVADKIPSKSKGKGKIESP